MRRKESFPRTMVKTQKTAGEHQKDQKRESEAEDQRKGGVEYFSPNRGNVPEEKDENEENNNSKDE